MIFKLQKFKVEKRGKNTRSRRDDFFFEKHCQVHGWEALKTSSCCSRKNWAAAEATSQLKKNHEMRSQLSLVARIPPKCSKVRTLSFHKAKRHFDKKTLKTEIDWILLLISKNISWICFWKVVCMRRPVILTHYYLRHLVFEEIISR